MDIMGPPPPLMRKKRILITGAAGFLGTNLIIRLLADGHDIVAVDYFKQECSSTVRELLAHPRCAWYRHDIREPLTGDMKHDLAYHLACPASPKYYQDDPAGTLKTCYTGTEMVLRHSRVYKAKVVVATTSGLNGQPAVYSQAESYHGNTNPYGPRACYDEGKRITESICYAFQFPPVPKPLLKSNLTLNNSQSVNGSSPEQSTRTYFPAVDIRIGRIFNTYGPHMPASDGRVVSTFIAAALKGEDLVIFGDGSARRVFQYVDDCIEGLLKLMDSNFWSPVNLAGQTEMSILELAHMIIRIVAQVKFDRGDFEGARVISRIVHGAQRIDDPPIRRPNICLAKEVLQYEAKTSMEVGLEKTILWMREELTKGPCRLLEE